MQNSQLTKNMLQKIQTGERWTSLQIFMYNFVDGTQNHN
jgi:hypothetical protein